MYHVSLNASIISFWLLWNYNSQWKKKIKKKVYNWEIRYIAVTSSGFRNINFPAGVAFKMKNSHYWYTTTYLHIHFEAVMADLFLFSLLL